MTPSSSGLGKWNPCGANEIVELKARDCCGGQSERPTFETLEDEGERTERESESFRREGTAVREELSEEKRLEPLVAEETEDLILAWSKDRRGFIEESVVENES